MDQIIVETRLLAKKLGKERFEVEVRLEVPQQDEDNLGDWVCRYTIWPLLDGRHEVRADNSLQVLYTALTLIQYSLDDFRKSGGMLFDEYGIELHSIIHDAWTDFSFGSQ